MQAELYAVTVNCKKPSAYIFQMAFASESIVDGPATASNPTVSSAPKKARNRLPRLSRLIKRAGSLRWLRASGRN